jgi:hypothetical protein
MAPDSGMGWSMEHLGSSIFEVFVLHIETAFLVAWFFFSGATGHDLMKYSLFRINFVHLSGCDIYHEVARDDVNGL